MDEIIRQAKLNIQKILECSKKKKEQQLKIAKKANIAGKTSAYGFFVKMCYEEHKKKYPDESTQVQVFLKRCSEIWKTMTEGEKRRFYELAQKDQERYQKEIQAYGSVVICRRRRIKKDPLAPKKALNPFIFFSNDKRAAVHEEHPEWRFVQISQEVGKLWRALSAEERHLYEQKAAEARARYEEEMRSYRQQNLAEPLLLH